jgi:hypothetical protein
VGCESFAIALNVICNRAIISRVVLCCVVFCCVVFCCVVLCSVLLCCVLSVSASCHCVTLCCFAMVLEIMKDNKTDRWVKGESVSTYSTGSRMR